MHRNKEKIDVNGPINIMNENVINKYTNLQITYLMLQLSRLKSKTKSKLKVWLCD